MLRTFQMPLVYWLFMVLLTFRNRIWKGLSQSVAVAVTGNRYRLSGFVKLLTLVGDALYHEVDFMMACSNIEGTCICSHLTI